jgi:hypothetical protein
MTTTDYTRRLAELDWAEKAHAVVQVNLDNVNAGLGEVERQQARTRALHWWQFIARRRLLREAGAIIISNRLLLAENRGLLSSIHSVMIGRPVTLEEL